MINVGCKSISADSNTAFRGTACSEVNGYNVTEDNKLINWVGNFIIATATIILTDVSI